MAALVVATICAYWPAIAGGWVWDDDSYVTENALVQSPDGVFRAWMPGETPQYYPLVFVSFWAQYAIHGLQPMWFHLVNVLLHCASAVLLWRLLLRLGVRGALLAAAIFALHPVQAESVAWITERKNVLSMVFALLSMLAWFRWSRPPGETRGSLPWFALSFLAFLAAMLSKTTAVAVPVALLAIEWWRGGLFRNASKAILLTLLPVGLVLGLITARLEVVDVGASGAEFDRDFVDRLAQAAQAWWFYPASWLWPANLMFIYPTFSQGSGGYVPWIALAGTLGVALTAAALALKGGRGFAALCVIYCAGIFPALGFINVYPLRYSPVADHFGYVAGVAVCIGVAWLLATVWQRIRSLDQNAARDHFGPGLAALLLAMLGVMTWTQCLPYRSESSLWEWTLERNPHAWIASNNLAGMQLEEARDAIARNDQAALAIVIERADAYASRAVEDTGGSDMPALANLAEVRRLQGRVPEALVLVEKAIAANPRYPGVRWQRGRLREMSGDVEGAGKDYEFAARASPPNAGYIRDWTRWLVDAGRLPEARDVTARLVWLYPNDADAVGSLANLQLETGDPALARVQYERAMHLASPDLAARLMVRMADACLRTPLEPQWIARGKGLAEQLVNATQSKEPIPLFLLSRAQALTGDPISARRTLEQANALIDGANDETRSASAAFQRLALEALGGAPSPNSQR